MKKTDMLEKYYHSQGAAFFEEGKLDEAVACFEHALALDDQPYTRWDLCRAYLEQEDVAAAEREINRAIALRPSSAQYYYRRSLVHIRAGNASAADEDRERSGLLDPNYSRVDAIEGAARVFGQLCSSAGVEGWPETGEQDDELAQLIVDWKGWSRPVDELEKRSCPLSCLAYCCHFSGETIRHGLYVGPWKLHAIRSFLKVHGLPEGDFLARTRFTGEDHLRRLIPPDCVIREGKSYFIYYPKRSRRRVGRRLGGIPKGIDYGDLEWTGEGARACAFLKNRRCLIYDAGDDPALPACKEFLCLTARVFMVVGSYVTMDEDRLRARSMEELNRIAVDLMVKTAGMLADPDLERLKRLTGDTLKQALEANGRGDSAARCSWVASHRHARNEFLRARDRMRERLQREVDLHV